MISRHTTSIVLALAAALATLCASGGAVAQTPSLIKQAAVETAAPPRDLSAPAADPVQGGIPTPPIESLPGTIRTQGPVGREREPRGNPLWAIPLRSLTATRERPLFTPSRRPPAPAVAGPPPAEPPPPPPTGPDRPQLILVGAISGDTEGIAIFLDQSTRDIVRLRTGESHPSGWTLRLVKGREAALVNGEDVVILALPAPGDDSQQPQSRPAPSDDSQQPRLNFGL
jgi:general secretion pathway protein N